MSLDNIITRIIGDAGARAGEIAKDARAKADEINAAASESAGALKQKIVGDAEALSRDETKRAYVMKNLEAKKEVAKKRLALIDKAFTDALAGLAGLDEVRYLKVVEDGIARLGEKEGNLHFSKTDSPRLNERFVERYNRAHGSHFALGGYYDPDDGGFILEKGRVRMDMRFSTLFKELRGQMLFETSAMLFE